MNELNNLKIFLDLKIKEEKESISSLYITYVHPFCASGGNYNEFISSNEILIQFPPGIAKIRRYLFQILLLMDIFHLQNKLDPLPDENMKQILYLIRSIAPIARIISSTILFDLFQELQFVHGEYFPQTIFYLMKSIGLTENDKQADLYKNDTSNLRRIHYDDGQPIPTGLEFQPNKTLLQNYPIFQNLDQNKNKIKKPKHGPEVNLKTNS